MGLQTLEILRQGIWASLTGGWFYDPHLDVFSNTFHLYVWLFLLCLPFTIYLFFPPTLYVWLAYCSSIVILFGTIKTANHALHSVYDTTECMEEPDRNSIQQKLNNTKKKSNAKNWSETNIDVEFRDLGIELQDLGVKTDTPPVECSSRNSYIEPSAHNADNDSIASDYTRNKRNSTIDLKVEIHRKNSSESSEEAAQLSKPAIAFINVHESESVCDLDRERRFRNKVNGKEWRMQRQKCLAIAEEDRSITRKLCRHASEETESRHSKPTSLANTCSESQIKQTSLPELEQQEHYPYWKSNQSVRRLDSLSKETPQMGDHPLSLEIISKKDDEDKNKISSHPQSPKVANKKIQQLVHPQSLETIRASTKNTNSNDDNNLPFHPQSLETINAKKSLPQNTLKRNQLQLLPYLSYDSEIVHPIEEQRDEQITNESVGHCSMREVSGPYFVHKEDEDTGPSSNRDRSRSTGRYDDKLLRYFGDPKLVKSSTNSRDALLEDPKPIIKRKYSNGSQSSWEFSDGERNKGKRIEKSHCPDDPANIGSIVEIDWLFENGNTGGDVGKTKNVNDKDPDSGSSSTTTLSLENEVKRKLLPESEVCDKRQQGAIPKQTRPKGIAEIVGDQPSIVETSNRLKFKRTLTGSNETDKITRERNTTNKFVHVTSGSNNELSTLLPASPVSTTHLNSGNEMDSQSNTITDLKINRPENRSNVRSRYKRLNRSNWTRRRLRHPPQDQDLIPLSRFIYHVTTNPDTPEDAVHYFRDDSGRWLAYTFDEKASGIPSPYRIPLEPNDKLLNTFLRQQLNRNLYIDSLCDESPDSPSNSCSSLSLNSAGQNNMTDKAPVSAQPASSKVFTSLPLNTSSPTVVENTPTRGVHPPFHKLTDSLERNRRLQNLLGNRDTSNSRPGTETNSQTGLQIHPQENLSWNRFIDEIIDDFNDFGDMNDSKSKPMKHYYKWKIGHLANIKVRFDRRSLLALLDRNLTVLETLISTILAVAVAGLGLMILQQGFYKDIFAFLFCFVTAGCQYSLLKSVQPDAASPTHGFNRIVVFSRPIYYIICTSLVLMLVESTQDFKGTELSVYGFRILDYSLILHIRNILLIFLLCFPIVFSLGLFPQINTFLMYLCEHLDIHIFGGNATTSLVSSIYSLGRSIVTVAILYGFAYGALTERKSSQHILFSIFAGLLVAISYHLSRSSSDPSAIWDIMKRNLWPPEVYLEEKLPSEESTKKKDSSSYPVKHGFLDAHKNEVNIVIEKQEQPFTSVDSELLDPLPQKLRSTVKARLKNDLIACSVIGILSFTIHSSTVFSTLQPELNRVLLGITTSLGFLLHYIMPQLRKHLPWLCLARPVLRSFEHAQFEVREPVRIMWFEKVHVFLCFIERNILYPIVFLGVLTECSAIIADKFGESIGALIIVICGLKSLRSAYSDSSSRYLVLIFTVLLFKFDLTMRKGTSETFLVDYFVTAIAFAKIYELLLKVRFIVTYIAPWQITWGSAFHAFAQPFSVPHSAMLFLQAGISSLLSTPLNPLLGSAIFITSYVRPIKFWERDYNTRRVDNSNTRMASHLERNLGADDNNLNSIFYEQLTRSLQHSLYGDLALGRWGNVEQGDCFLLASDYLNCLVHVIQLGNGLVTFQLRGLEFRGTYCQQREVEAISEGIEDNNNCCCCEIGHFSRVLSANAAFSQRWLAWEVVSAKYVLEGYSISDNSAGSMLQVFDFRKVLVTYYVKSIIFYAIKSAKLKYWLENQEIMEALKHTLEKSFVDLDPAFNMNIDEDFDFRSNGIRRNSFCNVYLDWIQFCAVKQDKLLERSRESCLVSLCFALSLLGRRVLGTASHNTVSSVEFFLYGLHALFKGDFRITCVRDEWVLHDVDLLRSVVAKGVRMALKLHQDHFMSPDQYKEPSALYEAIDNHDRNLVISHEADPLWRNAVLSGAPSLLALRHVLDDGIDEYKVIMLNKRYLSFRVIKMNRECVRGLWAGQQQELVYLRNRNPERGSIQNAKQALRNIINSSCDQPIGYPIYVSPLTTSYAETNQQLCSIIGGPLSYATIKNTVFKLWRRIRRRCGEGCSSGGTATHDDGGFSNDGVYAMTTYNVHSNYSGHTTSGSQSNETGCQIGTSTGRGSLGRANTSSLSGNCRSSLASVGKPTSSTLASLAGFLSSSEIKASESKTETSLSSKTEKEDTYQRVRIMDPYHVYDAINLGRRIDVIWPDEKMRQQGGRSGWQHWVPERGMEGCVVHRWLPNHRDPNRRSHVDKVILLVKIEDKYIPIAEQGVKDLGAEV